MTQILSEASDTSARFVLAENLVPQRRLRSDWVDCAIIALLLGPAPKAHRAGLRLFVTPDTILRWHRDLLPAADRTLGCYQQLRRGAELRRSV